MRRERIKRDRVRDRDKDREREGVVVLFCLLIN